MQKCEFCGREIKNIATGFGVSTVCEAEKLEFVTENGFKKSGYLVHKCNGIKDYETKRITNSRKN